MSTIDLSSQMAPPGAPRARIVCLEGPSAVGKTTLAAALAQWHQATMLARTAPLVVLDGDPFKGLWYSWIYPDPSGPGVEALFALHRTAVERGALAFPDMYVLLVASETQLRARRAADSGRDTCGPADDAQTASHRLLNKLMEF